MVLDPTMEFDRSTFALFSRVLDRAIDGLPAEIAQDNPASLLKQILETRIASQIVLGECDEQRLATGARTYLREALQLRDSQKRVRARTLNPHRPTKIA